MNDDPLSAARGMMLAMFLGVVAWLTVGALLFVAVRP
jgi:hypothetical protein